MIEISKGAGAVVASDVQQTVASVDSALLNGARMCISFLEATQGTKVPAMQSQKVLKSVTAGLNAVVEGRGEIVSAIRHMAAIQARSNLREEAYGCPLPWDDLAIFEPAGAARSVQTA
jgi:hypothetical protein